MPRKPTWSEDELVLALALYFQTPYSKISKTNPQFGKLGEIIGRSAGSVSCKLANFASLDGQREGLNHVGKDDKKIWDRYVENSEIFSLERLARDATTILSKLSKSDSSHETCFGDLLFPGCGAELENLPEGSEVRRLRVERINQSFFRGAVLRRYHEKCVITGLSCPSLLEAAHIVPWADDPNLRMVPANGLALNPLMHRAYDLNFIGIDADGVIHVHPLLLRSQGAEFETTRKVFESINRSRICCSELARPKPELLQIRYEKFANKEIPEPEMRLFCGRNRLIA